MPSLLWKKNPEKTTWDRIAQNYDTEVTHTTFEPLRAYERGEFNVLLNLIKSTHGELCLIELGCGTGRILKEIIEEQILQMHSIAIRAIIGVDNAPNMVRKANESLERFKSDEVKGKWRILDGDIRKLGAVMKENGLWVYPVFHSRRIVFCMLNTLGVFQRIDREAIINEMALVAGKEGKILLSLFDGNAFEKYAAMLYGKLPGIVGPFIPSEACDLSRHDFRNGDYVSHWSTQDEALEITKAGIKGTALADRQVRVTTLGEIAFAIEV